VTRATLAPISIAEPGPLLPIDVYATPDDVVATING